MALLHEIKRRPHKDIRSTKYVVENKSHSAELQRRLFELGAFWQCKKTGQRLYRPRMTYAKYFYVRSSGRIQIGVSPEIFKKNKGRELTLDDLNRIGTSKCEDADLYKESPTVADMYRAVYGGKVMEADFSQIEARMAAASMEWSKYLAHKGDEFKKAIFGEVEMKRHWKFKSLHPRDIDFDELADSVTRHNPIALVKGTYSKVGTVQKPVVDSDGKPVMRDLYDEQLDGVDARTYVDPTMPDKIFLETPVAVREPRKLVYDFEENYLVIHKQLWEKSLVTAIEPPAETLWRPGYNGNRIVAGIMTSDFGKWIRWAKRVKAAPWNDEDRRKASFEVDLPSI